jgi:hypothetical protein
MKISSVITLVFLTCSSLFGQVVVSFSDIQVLYRSYPNKIIVGSNGVSSDIVLKSETAQLTKEGNEWVAYIESGKSATIGAYANDILLQEYTYMVRPLPDPNIYFGNASDGEIADRNATELSVGYGPDIFLSPDFTVTSWTIISGGKEMAGSGSVLSSEAQELIKNSKESYITFIVNCKNPNGTMSKRSATMKLE